MIIPIGHEETTVRRLPWVSFTIMAICLIALILTQLSPAASRDRVDRRFEEAMDYFAEHPYLELDPRLQEKMFPGGSEEREQAFLEVVKQFGNRPPKDRDELRRQQEQLDRLIREALATVEKHPFFTYGLVPDDVQLHALITHMFMHGGWFHLLANMFIFYLCGPFIEDAWGRPLFVAFYLSAGLFAALMYVARYPSMDQPLVGASGAIAGVMGAFLVRFWKTKIKFFYWFGIIFRGTFQAPAWLMLPLWFGRELAFAQATDAVGGGGVAYWAHVWGFVFGAVFAVGMAYFKVEERFLTDSLEAKVTVMDNPVVDEAHDLWSAGRRDEAIDKLAAEVSNDPGNVEAAMAYWSLASQTNRAAEAAPALMAAIRSEVRSGAVDAAADQWLDLASKSPKAAGDIGVAARIAHHFVEDGRIQEAQEAIRVAGETVDSSTPPGVLVKLARAAAVAGGVGAARVLRAAAAHPEVPEPERATFLQALGDVPEAEAEREPQKEPPDEAAVAEDAAEDSDTEEGEAPVGSPDDEEEPVEQEPAEVWVPEKTLQVYEAVPISLSTSALRLNVDAKGEASISLDRLQAVAVAGIRPQGGKPFLLIDLLLDSPWGDSEKLRVVRLRGSRFDPQKVLSSETSGVEAFRQLVETIVKTSGASPIPSYAEAMGKPFATFSSLSDYESQVLGA